MPPFERASMTSYSTLMVTMDLSASVSKLQPSEIHVTDKNEFMQIYANSCKFMQIYANESRDILLKILIQHFKKKFKKKFKKIKKNKKKKFKKIKKKIKNKLKKPPWPYLEAFPSYSPPKYA